MHKILTIGALLAASSLLSGCGTGPSSNPSSFEFGSYVRVEEPVNHRNGGENRQRFEKPPEENGGCGQNYRC